MVSRRGCVYTLGGGIVIGFGLILPGLSGAVLAMGMGLYEPLIEAAAKPFFDWRGKLRLLAPLALGMGICVLLFSRLLEFLLVYYHLPTLYLFLGLVAGGLPSLADGANRKGFRLSFLASFGLAFGLIRFLAFLPSLARGFALGWDGLLPSVLLGMLAGAGLVVPGLSVSFLLMAFGAYQELLSALARLDYAVLLPVCVGLVPAIVLVSRLIDRLLKRMWGYAFYGILGLVIGSLYLVFPGLPQTFLETAACLLLFSVGFWVTFRFSRNYI